MAQSEIKRRAGRVARSALDSRAMTIGELKKIIEKLPDEMEVFASQHEDWDEPYSVSEAEVQEAYEGPGLILKATPFDEDEEE